MFPFPLSLYLFYLWWCASTELSFVFISEQKCTFVAFIYLFILFTFALLSFGVARPQKEVRTLCMQTEWNNIVCIFSKYEHKWIKRELNSMRREKKLFVHYKFTSMIFAVFIFAFHKNSVSLSTDDRWTSLLTCSRFASSSLMVVYFSVTLFIFSRCHPLSS